MRGILTKIQTGHVALTAFTPAYGPIDLSTSELNSLGSRSLTLSEAISKFPNESMYEFTKLTFERYHIFRKLTSFHGLIHQLPEFTRLAKFDTWVEPFLNQNQVFPLEIAILN